MKAISSLFLRQVHDSSRGTPVFGGEVVRDDVEFLYRVDRNLFADYIRKDTDILNSVEKNLGARLALPINRVTDTAAGQLLTAVRVVGRIVPAAHISGEDNKVVGIARKAWQLGQLLRVHNL